MYCIDIHFKIENSVKIIIKNSVKIQVKIVLQLQLKKYKSTTKYSMQIKCSFVYSPPSEKFTV